MKGQQTSVHLVQDLRAAALAQAKVRGYKSLSAYFAALIRLDTINEKTNDHELALRIAEMGAGKRDRIDEQIRRKAEEASDCWELVKEDSPELVVPSLFKTPQAVSLARAV